MQNEPSTSSAFCFFQGHKGDTRERKIEGEVEGSQPSKRFCLLLPVWARSNCSLDVSRAHNQRQLASEKASFAPLHSARRALYVEPMPRRKLFPIPIEGAVDHPDFVAMPSAAAGSLFRIILHFWQTQCRSLPIADWELRSIARAHAPTWRRWKPRSDTPGAWDLSPAEGYSRDDHSLRRATRRTNLGRKAAPQNSRREGGSRVRAKSDEYHAAAFAVATRSPATAR
jgi:hypothetical protein